MHSVLSYSTYNIPPLTEYIPVLPAKGLDDGGDCRAGHIRLRPASTIVRQWLITWSLSVAQISYRPAWCFRVPLASSPYSTTTHPYSSSASSSSSPSSRRQLPLFITWPGASMFRNCMVLVKLYTYMFGSIHNHGQHLSADGQLINLSNVLKDSYMVFMVLGS